MSQEMIIELAVLLGGLLLGIALYLILLITRR